MLLASAGFGSNTSVPNQVALRAVTSWSGAPYSSLLPLNYQDEMWWIRAHLTTPVTQAGLSLATIREQINRDGLEFHVEQSCGSADFVPMATLRLTAVIPLAEEGNHDVSFDPVRHSAPDVQVWPEWLRNFRALAYRSSREGRDAES